MATVMTGKQWERLAGYRAAFSCIFFMRGWHLRFNAMGKDSLNGGISVTTEYRLLFYRTLNEKSFVLFQTYFQRGEIFWLPVVRESVPVTYSSG